VGDVAEWKYKAKKDGGVMGSQCDSLIDKKRVQ
jgi:hypothetical protein